ncbi:MAG: tetratricopeptide repeat protein [Gammaproteobacteria bacterium]
MEINRDASKVFRRVLSTYFVMLMLCLPLQAECGIPRFEYKATITATALELDGTLELTLSSGGPVYNAELVIESIDQIIRIAGPRTWTLQAAHVFQIEMPSSQPLPGRYHLLLSIEYQDDAEAWHSFPLAVEYLLGTARDTPVRAPQVLFKGDQLRWQLAGVTPDDLSLTLSSAPNWEDVAPLTPEDHAFKLVQRPDRMAVPGGIYPQLARLDWSDRGFHHSKLIPWSIRTDQQGQWLRYTGVAPQPAWWRSALWLQILSITVAGFALLWTVLAFRQHRVTSPPAVESSLVRYIGWLLAAGISLWVADHTRLDLWILPTWTTGGDTASHILYASVFRDWVAQGRISGWMPEVFMGFPAFSYYFPMPFVLGVYLSKLFGLPVAFKFIAMLPAVLLPFATYVMGALLRWPVAARLLGAAGAAGFVLTTGTSIWGGNLMAQMAGEFAYSWGFLWTVIFWGVLGWALRRGGRVWILAAMMEVLVAFSHGYALLTAGFGAFLFLLLFHNWNQTLRIILQVHTLAFLLLGFWLIPLMTNLPWTIPNDTSMWVERWQTLWPKQLWPLSLGLPYLITMLFLSRPARAGLGFPLGICVFGLMAFHVAHQLGLADIRFFPYAQWGAAVALAAGTGWLIYRSVPASLLWAGSLVIALMSWWEPDTGNIENWARWNLEGYEVKARWPAYRAIADSLSGTLKDARVIFEHDPDNNDLGSTRTVEAMPLFGSRPVLEGLYMESAISSAFIYQLQAEISNRPSSPLSRFPSSKGTIDAAIGHMNEFYTDTLVLRSEQMKRRFRDDDRFEVLLQQAPFLVLRLKEPESRLVDIISGPLVIKPREGWMNSAFRRFRLSHPYASREVYPSPDQAWQIPAPATGGDVRLLGMERERLVFETTAVGQPHIIRMTYHPKWKSLTGEPVFLTEPAFMLVIPQQSRVELRYGATTADHVGAGLTLLGIVVLVLILVFPRMLPGPVFAQGPALKPTIAVLVLALSVSLWSWWNNPERKYKQGHEQLSDERYLSAARAFDKAYSARKVPGKKAEALFWAGRSYELKDEQAAALERYRELVSHYPDNFWAAESLYRIVLLARQAGDERGAGEAYKQLLQDFPGNRWAQEANKASGTEPDGDESERIYRRGHKQLKEQRYVSAARAFDRAYSARKVPAKKAEALFWAGRSLEFADDHYAAIARYRELVGLYPDNYWVAESLYRIVLVARQAGAGESAEDAYNQMLQDYPENSWTQKAMEIPAAKQ